jgi:hypothetical protein
MAESDRPADEDAARPICPEHGAPLPPACPECVARMQRPVESMTGDERAAELEHWGDTVLTVEFADLHQRLEALVGRPVWTHEMGSQMWPNLVAEARSQEHPADLEAHVIGSLDQVAGTRPVVVARIDDFGSRGSEDAR